MVYKRSYSPQRICSIMGWLPYEKSPKKFNLLEARGGREGGAISHTQSLGFSTACMNE